MPVQDILQDDDHRMCLITKISCPIYISMTGNDRKNGGQFTCNMLDALESNESKCFVSMVEKIKFQRIGIQVMLI